MWSTTCTQTAVLGGWGAHLQELTASGIWSQDQSQLHINVLELRAIWLGLKAFSQRVENAKVALMSDNTSAVASPEKSGGTKSLAMSDLATDICLWAEKREWLRHLPGHLNVLADHLSQRGQIFKTEWSLNQNPNQDLSYLGQTIHRFVRPGEKHKTGKVHLPHSGGDGVESLVQNWDGLYAYAYPPTSLIRACLNKVRTERVDIILIAPGWHQIFCICNIILYITMCIAISVWFEINLLLLLLTCWPAPMAERYEA